MNREEKQIYRMVDANYNRAKEALRVVEDLLRFAPNGASASAAWKKCRHGLSGILLGFPRSLREMVACRDTGGDPGRKSFIRHPGGKPGLRDLFAANTRRAEEALRVLEECSKAVHPKASAQFQAMRFKIYALEKRDFKKI